MRRLVTAAVAAVVLMLFAAPDAVMTVPKCGLAMATRPFQRGWVKSRIECGASPGLTLSVL